VTRLLLLCLTLFAASSARADERLSDRGRVLIAGTVGGWWANRDDWHIHVDPSASYFLIDRLALGGYLGYSDRRTAPYGLRQRDFSLGVQAVGDLPLGKHVSWFAVAKVGYTYRRGDHYPALGVPGLPSEDQFNDGFGYSAFTPIRHYVNFGLFLPFVVQFNEHVGLGFGPDIQIDWPPADYYSIDVRLGLATWIPISI
jgi:hypothetical protein